MDDIFGWRRGEAFCSSSLFVRLLINFPRSLRSPQPESEEPLLRREL